MDSLDIIALKDFILFKNTYFGNGYADAFALPENGAIVYYDGNGLKPIFPDDTKGNYFYIRSDAGVAFNLQDAQRLTDSGAARYTFIDSALYYLVAVVKDADRYKLINNLRNTCAMFSSMNIIPTAGLWVSEAVVANELAGADEKAIQAALNKMKSTIVRLTISVNKTYASSNCIEDVCKC